MKWKESSQYENPQSGSWPGRCVQVIDMGTQERTWQGETKSRREVRIMFELPTHLMEGKYKPELRGKPFALSVTFKQSMHPKSSLRPFLEAWRGRKFTKEEIDAYDPRRLLGACARLSLMESEDGQYVNIDSASKLNTEEIAVLPKQVNPYVYFSLEREEFNPEVLAKLPEKLQEKIKSSPEYRALFEPEKPKADADEVPMGDEPSF